MEFVYLTFVVHFRRHKANFRIETLVTKQFQVRRCPDNVFAETPPYLLGIKYIINSFKKHIEPLSNFGECPQHGKRSLTSLKIRCPGIYIPGVEASPIVSTWLSVACSILAIVTCTDREENIRMAFFDVRPDKLAFVICNSDRIIMKQSTVEIGLFCSRIDEWFEESRCSSGGSRTNFELVTFPL